MLPARRLLRSRLTAYLLLTLLALGVGQGCEALLARHGLTLQDWDSSLVWYSTHELENYT